MFRGRLSRRWLKRCVIAAVCGVVALAVLFGALWFEHRSDVTLPAPSGSFAVGRTVFVWGDNAQADIRAAAPGTKRELLVWLWYPATVGHSGAGFDAYIPAELRAPDGRVHAAPFFTLLTRDRSKVHGHSHRSPDVSSRQQSYPVVILRGGASAEVVNYSTLAEDLASHGYIVVGFDAPYRTRLVVFPDGRVCARTPENDLELVSGDEVSRRANKLLEAWCADASFVLDRLERLNASDPSGRLTGRLDMGRVGIFGHSFGGATAAQFCAQDSRCKAGIDVDGALHGSVIQAGIDKPFMFLLSDHGDFSSDAETRRIYTDIQSVFGRLPAQGRLRVAVRGANHFTFSDDGAILKSSLTRGVLRVLGILRIDGRRQLAVTAHCVHRFFDVYLKGASQPPLRISSPLYPEIQVLE